MGRAEQDREPADAVDEVGAEPLGFAGEPHPREPDEEPAEQRPGLHTGQAVAWFRTGNAGYRDEAGFLFILDRVKDLIISGGENVYPIEVEQVLAEHPAVADVCVIGVRGVQGRRRAGRKNASRPGGYPSAADNRNLISGYCAPRRP
ncbi:MAG: hypothetical protein JF587_02170 [Catenulisporales bacterium]|nr:hypothetical protein [Catenulisporales bacterium]